MMYALTPARRTAQVLGDLGVLVWCVVWAQVGRAVHGLVDGLAGPARQLQTSAGEFTSAMAEAGTTAGTVPFAGDRLRESLDRVARVGTDAAGAGARFETTVEQLAVALALAVALGPALGLAIPWILARVRFARRASAARAFLDGEADLDLFALRAMAHQPLPRLAAVSADPVTAWRAGDRDVIRALASLELRSVGLRPPADPRRS